MIDVMQRKSFLQEAYAKYQSLTELDHLRRSAKRFVPGEGPLHAHIMLVGEAPGEREDASGRPFAGPAGETLDLLIKRAKLQRDAMFITNIVKYRPLSTSGQNRKPTKKEVTDSLECLSMEITLCNPKVIALMGNTAIKAFYPSHSATKDHGTIYKASPTSRSIVFLYHPSVADYTPYMKQDLIDDFKVITEALKE